MSAARPPRLPYVLIEAMPLVVVAGPFATGAALRGGPSPVWPPDRPVEWATLLGTSGVVLGLMLACLSLALINRKVLTEDGLRREAAEDRP